MITRTAEDIARHLVASPMNINTLTPMDVHTLTTSDDVHGRALMQRYYDAMAQLADEVAWHSACLISNAEDGEQPEDEEQRDVSA